MTKKEFKDWIFDKFIEWEKEQHSRRSSFSAFARWLSDNSINVEIKQQLLNDWINGRYKPKENKYLLVLEEKIGEDVYEILETEQPDPTPIIIETQWEKFPEKIRHAIREEVAKYETARDIHDRKEKQ
jgi:hypothetical protein